MQDISATKAFISCVQNYFLVYAASFAVQFCTQLTKAFMAEMSYNQLLIDTATYIIAHNQFAYIEERSNEPLQH